MHSSFFLQFEFKINIKNPVFLTGGICTLYGYKAPTQGYKTKRPNKGHLKLFDKNWTAVALNCCPRFEFSSLADR